MKARVEIFRNTGKYYTSGEYEVDGDKELFELWEEFREMAKVGNLPGVIDSCYGYELSGGVSIEIEWLVYYNVPGHRNEHPRIFILYYSRNSFAETLQRLRELKERLLFKPQLNYE